MEFDDRTGPVRDALASSVASWQAAVRRALEQAQDEGHLTREVDPLQVAFEVHGLILALHYEARFLKVPGATGRARQGFAAILERYRQRPEAASVSPQRQR